MSELPIEVLKKEEAVEYLQDQIEMRVHQKLQSVEMIVSNLMREFKSFKNQHENQLAEVKQMVQHISDENRPVIEWFKNINFTKSAIMWILGFVASIVGLLLAFRELFKE